MTEDTPDVFSEFREETGRAREIDADRCEAFAESTGEQCQHDAVDPFPYCGDHMELLDEVDLRRMGLKPPKSGG